MSMVDTITVPVACLIEQEEDSLTQYYFGKSSAALTQVILKSRENICKSKSRRILRKKLKKYKLNKDGIEDPDVVDVSQALNESLKLSSPRCDSAKKLDDDIGRRENYLQMVRRKKTLLHINSIESPDNTKFLSMEDQELVIKKKEASGVVKKQTNAFKLLMDSRNKSMGSNSPGKEQTLNELEPEERSEQQKNKVKRNLALQKMADAKGAQKKVEIEEIQEACVKKKMEKRALRLKKMLNHKNNKKKTPKNQCLSDDEDKNVRNHCKEKVSYKSENGQEVVLAYEKKILNSTLKNNPPKKRVLKEDLEFLSKLSPSIKKKENMLCYFQKVEKEVEVLSVDEIGTQAKENGLKVKIVMKAKRNKKPSPNETCHVMACNKNNTIAKKTLVDGEEIVSQSKKTNRKRKRKNLNESSADITKHNNLNVNSTMDSKKTVEGRPRRNTKRPAKYDDEIQHLSSSEEELHIFTPKKKRHGNNTCYEKPKRKSVSKLTVQETVDEEKVSKKKNKEFAMKNNEDIKNISRNSTKSAKQSEANTPMLKLIKTEDAEDKENYSKKNDKDLTMKDHQRTKNMSKAITENVTQPNSAKLAPIFKKTITDPLALEAKQKFLQSGMPDQFKKVIAQQKTQDTLIDCFYPVVHIQQYEETPTVPLIGLELINESEYFCIIEDIRSHEGNDMKKLLHINHSNDQIATPLINIDVQETLKYIKESYPKFPVYRTYKTLSNKKRGDHKDLNCADKNNSSEILSGAVETKHEDPEQLNWCSKYRATSTKQILGNFDSIQELRKWLITWTSNDTNDKDSKNNSDSDFDEYDTDSRDSMRISNNLLALTGPVGSGKTSSVYAVAAELAIKVIEVNVSSKRTGKILLQDLQEATQSHKVNRGKGSSTENSQEIFTLNTNSNKQMKKSKFYKEVDSQHKSDSHSRSHEDGRTVMSLILIDDADVVFDQDDGFVSAIAQLIQCSKRPVILVVTTLNCQHLQKFLLSGTILKMNSLSPRILGTWLDILCLADTDLCWPGFGEKCLNFYKGDIRKAINYLQFLLASETQKSSTDDVVLASTEHKNMIDLEEEKSNCSIVDYDQSENIDILGQSNTLMKKHHADHLIKLIYPLDLFHVWWNMPTVLKSKHHGNAKESIESKKDCLKELESLSGIIDSISIADCFSNKIGPDTKLNISSYPWLCVEADSVSEKENFDFVNNHLEVVHEISHDIVQSSLSNAQQFFMTQDGDIGFPGLTDYRSREKIIVRHDTMTNAINPSSILDRKALSLDYWSACRGICRTEREKTESNSKRHKRFTHYLKSSMVINKSVFDKLCGSLQPADERQ